MKRIIKLNKIDKTINGEIITLNFEFEIDGKAEILTYSISGGGVKDCVSDRCDSFVVAFLYYAMALGYDYESDYPISESLYYNLMYHYLPQMQASNKGKVHDVKIKAPITDNTYKGTWNVTGISCGIDSLSTLKEYTEDCNIDEYKLTHLLYFKVGAHHGLQFPTPPDVEDRVFKEELQVASEFCEKYRWPLVIVESNINHLSNTLFGQTEYELVLTFRCISAALILQNCIKRYYIATGYADLQDFDMDIDKSGVHRLWWKLPLFSSANMQIIPANKAMSRLDKTKYISDFEPSYDSLMVCWKDRCNCGFCAKCVRTLVPLDMLGVLDRYSKSFNLPMYYKYKGRLRHRIVALRHKDQFFGEIYDFMKLKGIPIPNRLVSYLSFKYQCNRRKLPSWLDRILDKLVPN